MRSAILIAFLIAAVSCYDQLASVPNVDHESIISFVMENSNENGEFEFDEHNENAAESLMNTLKSVTQKLFMSNNSEHMLELTGNGAGDSSFELKVDNKTVGTAIFNGKGKLSMDGHVKHVDGECSACASGSRNATLSMKAGNKTANIDRFDYGRGRISVRRLGPKEMKQALKHFDRKHRDNLFNCHLYRMKLESSCGYKIATGNTTAHDHKSVQATAHIFACKGRSTRISAHYRAEGKHTYTRDGKTREMLADGRGNCYTTVRAK